MVKRRNAIPIPNPLVLFFALALALITFTPAVDALISPEFWDGTVPCLSVDGRHVELQPDFTREHKKQSYIMRSAAKLLRDMQRSTCFRGCSHVDQAESKKEAAAALKDSSLIDVNAWRVSWSSLSEVGGGAGVVM
eukprot:768164-Hanusia_phi.AAC.3